MATENANKNKQVIESAILAASILLFDARCSSKIGEPDFRMRDALNVMCKPMTAEAVMNDRISLINIAFLPPYTFIQDNVSIVKRHKAIANKNAIINGVGSRATLFDV